ncbi:MAG: ATP-dependent 6-phosphofructokinase [Halanaerobium sp.]
MKRIGVLTSGGDAPGMNSAVRSIVKTAINKGAEIYGIKCGFIGLLEMKFKKLNVMDIDHISSDGGTFLKTGRTEKFKTEAGINLAVENIKRMGLDGLIIIGGNGSIMGAKKLAEKGVKVIAVPGTIDNDIAGTDYSIGFDTACNVVINSVDKILDTAHSLVNENPRVFLIEVMGRKSGDIAVHSALSGGVDELLVPGKELNYEEIISNLKNKFARGKEHAIIIMAEGVGDSDIIKEKLEVELGFKVKKILLGHLQRGGNPTAFDRTLAARLGYQAVQSILDDHGNFMVGIKNSSIELKDIEAIDEKEKEFDHETFELSQALCR